MKRHKIRGFLSSIFRDHFDSDNPEWLEEHRKEIENNVKKILKLVNEEKEGNPNEGEELASLIEDFYKHYQILHERYDRLAGDLKKNVNGSEKTDVSSSSSSSSDSESEKSKIRNDKGGRHKKSASGYRDLETQNGNLMRELEASHEVENDLKQKLMSITEERSNLMSQNVKAWDRIKEADKKIEELLLASEQLNKDRLQLEIEKSELKLQLETEIRQTTDTKNRLEATTKEKDALSLEILVALSKAEDSEKAIENLTSEIKILREENLRLLSAIEVVKEENSVTVGNLQRAHKSIENYFTEMEKLKTENSVLRDEKEDVNKEVGNLNEILRETYAEKDILSAKLMSILGKLETAERTIGELNKETQILKLDLSERDTINGDMKKEVEEAYQKFDNLKQVLQSVEEDKNKLILENSEALNKIQQTEMNFQEMQNKVSLLMEEIFVSQQSRNDLEGQILDLEKGLQDKEEQISDILRNFESEKNEAFGQIDALKLQINELQMQHSSLCAIIAELEGQIEILKNDTLEKHKQMEILKEDSASKIRDLEQKYEERGQELSNFTKMLEDVENKASRQIDDLQSECSLLHLQKKEFEEQMEIMKNELTSKILELQKLLEEKEEMNRLLGENHRQLEVEFHKSCDELQKAESKIRDVEEGHQVLRVQVNDLTLEVASLGSLKDEMEEQLGKAKGELSELELQKEKLYQELQSKISDQERILQERDDNLNELDMKCKQLDDQVSDLCKNLKIAEQKIEESEEERRRVEESKDVIIQNMQLSIEERSLKMLEDVENKASRQIDDLQSECSLLRSQKMEFEEQMEIMKNELTSKILELQKLLEEKEEMYRLLGENHRQLEVEFHKSCDELQKAENKIRDVEEGHQVLILQVNDLTQEVASLGSLKGEIEEQLGKAKGELSELELQKEKLYQELQSKISDQERILQERDDNLNELDMKCKQLDDQVSDLCKNLKIAEQKIEESEEERRRVEESKDVIIQNMQLFIEERKKGIEIAEEEISRLKGEIVGHGKNYKLLQISAEDEKADLSKKMSDLCQVNDDQKEEIAKLQVSVQNAEVQLRLSTRKLQITESEFEKKEEMYRMMEEEMHEKHKLLEEQVLTSYKKIHTLENEKKEMFGTTVTAMKSLNVGFDNLLSTIQKLDENYCQMHTRLSEFSTELQTMKRCVSDMISQKHVLKGEIHDLTERLKDTGKSKSLLEKKLGVLETTATETVREKNKLMDTVTEFVKKMGEAELKVQRKEVEMEEKNEEKREAIRQLCIYMEYYRENHDLLKESLLKMLNRTRRSI